MAKIYKSLGALTEHRIVSKPQILSRLRHVNIVERPNETAEERTYRLQYEALQNWNDKYWAENNQLFNQSKADYIKSNFKDISEQEALSHDQLAKFYRKFLEENRDKHVRYNRTWYRGHLALLASSMRAKLSRLRANMLETKEPND